MDLIPTGDISRLEPVVIGAGGIGSPVITSLAKMGVEKMHVYDDDVVDAHNVPNQMYGFSHIGKPKVEAVADMAKDYGCEIIGHQERFESQEVSGPVIAAVDSMTSRYAIWEQVKLNPNVPVFIDARMGALVYRLLSGNPTQRGFIKWYEEHLFPDSEGIELPCTARAIIFNTLGVASEVCSLVRKFVLGNALPRKITFDYESGIRLVSE